MSYIEKNSVEDFVFNDVESLKQAKKEAEAIVYIKSRMDFSKPRQVLAVYNKMIEKNMFSTPVGLAYLKEVREFLKKAEGIDFDDIKIIPVAGQIVIKEQPKEDPKAKKEKQKLKDRLRLSFIINLLLAIVVIAMFAIQLTTSNPNIVNYEEEVLNKYSGWQQELNEKEMALNERESRILEKEEELGLN